MQQYDKTEWVPEVTLVSAQRLNKMERQLETLTNESIKSNSQLNNVIAKNNEFDKVLNNAKYDYFGDEHISVVERLASDFDNVHQRINDSSYLLHEGSNITANNSYYGYTKEMSVKGRTLQNLAGPLIFSTHGSDIFVTNKQEYFLCTKTSGSTQLLKVSAKINCDLMKPNTTYTVILNKIYDSNDQFCVYDATTESFLRNYVHSNVLKFTTKSDVSHIRLYFQNNVVNETRFYKDILILEGDYTNIDFDIPYFEGIKSVCENEVIEEGKYPVKIKSCGKNLFKDNNWYPLMSLTGSALTEKPNKITDYEKELYVTFFAYLNKGTYILSCSNDCIRLNRESRNGILKGLPSVKLPYKFTVDYKQLVGFSIERDASDTNPMDIPIGNNLPNDFKIQIEKGTISTDYEPYQESVQEILLDEPLRNLPNGVCDEITECGVLIRRCGESVLDGSKLPNKHTIHANGGTYTRFRVPLQGLANSGTSSAIRKNCVGLSDKLCQLGETPNGGTVPSTAEGIYNGAAYYDSTPVCYISIANSKLTNGGIVEWLKTNPIKVIYELATPIEIPLTNYNINLKTFDGTTYITSTNSLQAIISCKVPTNVQETISNLIEENETLNDQVSTLNLENEEIKTTNANQDELINTTMMAADEMYMMLEPLLADMLVDGETVSPLVNMYIAMINRGLKTIEQVPEKWREQVKKELGQLQE